MSICVCVVSGMEIRWLSLYTLALSNRRQRLHENESLHTHTHTQRHLPHTHPHVHIHIPQRCRLAEFFLTVGNVSADCAYMRISLSHMSTIKTHFSWKCFELDWRWREDFPRRSLACTASQQNRLLCTLSTQRGFSGSCFCLMTSIRWWTLKNHNFETVVYLKGEQKSF